MSITSSLKPAFVAVALFSFVVNALALVTSLYMMLLFDRVMPSGNLATLFWLTVIAVGAILFMGLLDGIRTLAVTRIGAWLEARIAPTIIARGLTRPEGATIKPYEDLMKVKHFVGSAAVYPLLDAPWIPFFVAVLYLMHPWYGHLAVGSAVLLFSLAVLTEATTRKATEEASYSLSAGRKIIEAGVRNADSAKAMAMQHSITRRWEAINASGLALQLAASARAGWLGSSAKAVRLSVQIAVLAVGVLLALQGQVTGGAVIGASILLAKALSPVEQAINSWKSFVAARAGWRSIRAQAEEPEPEKSKLPDATGSVTLENVTWAPARDADNILQDIALEIRPGEILGVIGPSASGKSTLCRLVSGSLAPSSGHVRMDGADYAVWRHEDLGQAIGYLPQEVELFPVSVAENIARLADAPDMDQVVAAAKLAGAHEFIMSLPAGYDTVVSSDGRNLSGGQRQRIGLARALFGRPPLIILDEPNANLDEAGDKALITALLAARRTGSAIVLVSHRPSVMVCADRIIVMSHGRIAAAGPARDIIERLSKAKPAAAA